MFLNISEINIISHHSCNQHEAGDSGTAASHSLDITLSVASTLPD